MTTDFLRKKAAPTPPERPDPREDVRESEET